MQSTDAPEPRFRPFDGLRAIAVGAVIIQHSFGFVPIPFVSGGLEFGTLGVRLFFVLSGFLITGILLRARRAAADREGSRWQVWRAFYFRRALRIFPLAYAVLAVAWIAGAPTMRSHPWMYLTYTSNYYVGTHGFTDPSLDHFWSLAIEEQFYLVWPLVLLATPQRWMWAGISAVIVSSMLARGVILAETGAIPSYVTAAVLTPSRLDALAIGGLLAWYQLQHSRLTTGLAVALMLGGVAARAAAHLAPQSPVLAVFHETGNILLSAAVVVAVSRGSGWLCRVLSLRPLVAIGTISYGIYVYHMVIAGLAPIVAARLDLPAFYPIRPGWERFIWMIGTTMPIAAASWRWFERPLNDLKSRFPYVGRLPRNRTSGREHQLATSLIDTKEPASTPER